MRTYSDGIKGVGHINWRFIQETASKCAVHGLDLYSVTPCGIFVCEDCLLGKAKRKPFPSVELRECKPGEIVHADLSGKFRVKSLGGSFYYLMLKDEASTLRTVYFLKRKGQTFPL